MIEIEQRRQQLSELRRKIVELHDLREDSSGVVQLDQSRTGRLSRVDSLQRQAIAQHGKQLANLRLRKIDAALRRCDQGTYGLCLECDEPISQQRLDVDPAAELCIGCAQARE